MSKKQSKYTKETAMGKLGEHGIVCSERTITDPNVVTAVVNKMTGKQKVERTITVDKPPGIKLWGIIDYLVKYHKFQVIFA